MARSFLLFLKKNCRISRSSGSRQERTGQEQKEENLNILLKIEQSLDTIGKSGLDCRGGAESDNVGPTTAILSSLSEKLDTIQAGLDIHKWETKTFLLVFIQIKVNTEDEY